MRKYLDVCTCIFSVDFYVWFFFLKRKFDFVIESHLNLRINQHIRDENCVERVQEQKSSILLTKIMSTTDP